MIQFLLESPRPLKRLISVTYDTIGIPIAIYAALALRNGVYIPDIGAPELLTILGTTAFTIALFIRLGLYRAVVRFMTEKAFATLMIGMATSSLILGTLTFLNRAQMPRSSIIMYLFIGLVVIGLPRLFVRSVVSQIDRKSSEAVLIYGAGRQGIALSNAINNGELYHASAFVDDNKRKAGSIIQGLQVHHTLELDTLLKGGQYKKVLLALGTTHVQKRKSIIETLSNYQVEILTAPPVQDILSGKAKIEEVKEIDISDLLGRDAVHPNQALMHASIKGKHVLITGAGGSIGSELCRQALLQRPKLLVLFELNEYSLYRIEQDLQMMADAHQIDTQIVPMMGSVQKQNRLETIFETFNIQTIYHAAAYKHVPLVEHNVVEGVRNNVYGTWYCAEAAIKAGVERFVLVSTDKAVRPTNVMGASKRLAELVLQALSERQHDTTFCMVRFGNVLGSSGSVVPLFRKQIKEHGPITVTHPDIIRYFMTIPEASQLVIQAGAMGKGGDVFVLDMGNAVKIVDLAKKMIRLSGLSEKTDTNPDGDIEIQFTGLRPGEKLYEELLIGDEVQGSEHPRIMTANETHLTWPETHNLLRRLDEACHNFDVTRVIELLKEAPAAYKQDKQSPDWVLNASVKQRS